MAYNEGNPEPWILGFIVLGFAMAYAGYYFTKPNESELSEMKRVKESYMTTCQVRSIMVDDDAEYHFTVVDMNGNVVSFNNIDSQDLSIRECGTSKPKAIIDSRELFPNNKMLKGTTIELPIGYTIERFED